MGSDIHDSEKVNDFFQKYKCRYNGFQKAFDKDYKEHVYNKISISDYAEFLKRIKIPIMNLIKNKRMII